VTPHGAAEHLEPGAGKHPERERAGQQRAADPAERAGEARRRRAGRLEDHACDRSQVVGERDDPVRGRDQGQPREAARERRVEHEDLAGEARQRGDAGERQERGRERERGHRRAPDEPAEPGERVRPRRPLELGRERERAEVHEQVRGEVERDGGRRPLHPPGGGDRGEDVARLRHARVRQQPLEAGLAEGGEVAERHRRGREAAHQLGPGGELARERGHEHPDERGHRRDLRDHGQEARRRRGRAIEHVRHPEVERDRRDLEAEPDQHERERQPRPRRIGPGQRGADLGEVQAAGEAVQEGEPVPHDGERGRPEQQELERGLERARVAADQRGEEVAPEARHLEEQEEQAEVVGGGEPDRSERREHQRHRRVRCVRVPAKVRGEHGEGRERSDEDEQLGDLREAIEPIGPVEHRPRRPRQRREDRRGAGGQGRARDGRDERAPATAEQSGHRDEHEAGRREDELRHDRGELHVLTPPPPARRR
jgi:hypothetical protein